MDKSWSMSGKTGRFIMVPEEVIYKELKGNELLVFLVLCSRVSGPSGQVVISRNTVSEITGIHINNISPVYKSLQNKGYIKSKKQVSLNGANKFQLAVPNTDTLSTKITSTKQAIKDRQDTMQNDLLAELEFAKELPIEHLLEDEQEDYARHLQRVKHYWENRKNWKCDFLGVLVNKWGSPILRLNGELIYDEDEDAAQALIAKEMHDYQEYLEALR